MIPDTDEELLAECTVETFKSSGKGGQHVNTTESAVRLRHLPTGVVATSQAERSQHRNKRTALKALRRKLERLNYVQPPRVPTKKTRAAKERTLKAKTLRSRPRKTNEQAALNFFVGSRGANE